MREITVGHEPVGGESMTNITVTGPPQLSLTVPPRAWKPWRLVAGGGAVHCAVIGGGQLMTGAIESIAVSVWVHSLKLPHESVARYLRLTMYGLAWHPAPPLLLSPAQVIVTMPPQ